MLRRALAAVREWLLNPKCPLCKERTPHLEAHMYVNHYGGI
jgi:hypothetical protein